MTFRDGSSWQRHRVAFTSVLLLSLFSFFGGVLVNHRALANQNSNGADAGSTGQGAKKTIAKEGAKAGSPSSPSSVRTLGLLAQRRLSDGSGVSLSVAYEGTSSTDGAGNARTITATVYQRVRSRASFSTAANGSSLGSVLGLIEAPELQSSEVDRGFATRELALRFGMGCSGCVGIALDGVYPVKVELRTSSGDETAASFVTFVTRSTTQRVPLRIGLVVDVHAPPATPGTTDDDGVASRSVIAMIEALTSIRKVPLTIRVTPQTLVALEPRTDPPVQSDLVNLLRASLDNRELLATPYVRVPNAVVQELSTAALKRELFTLGETTLRERLPGVAPTTDTLLVEDGNIPDDNILDELGIARLLVLPNAVDETDTSLLQETMTAPVLVDPGARSGRETAARPTVILDSGLAKRFLEKSAGASDDVVRAQHVLAEMTLISIDLGRPTSEDEPQGLAVLVPAATTQATLVGVLDALQTTTSLLAVPTSTLFDSAVSVAANGAPVVVRPRPADVAPTWWTSALKSRYEASVDRRNGYLSLFGTVRDDATALEERGLAEAAVMLLAQDLPGERNDAVRTHEDALGKRIGIVADRTTRRITLTARRQPITLAFVNDSGRPVTLILSVESDTAQLPAGRRDRNRPARQVVQRTIVVERRVHEETVEVATKGPGRYSVLVRLSTPTGVQISQSRITLQATAIGAIGRVLTIGSLFVLALWWSRTIWKTRRKRAEQHVVSGPAVHRSRTP